MFLPVVPLAWERRSGYAARTPQPPAAAPVPGTSDAAAAPVLLEVRQSVHELREEVRELRGLVRELDEIVHQKRPH